MPFELHSPYSPNGDQPSAIEKLIDSLSSGNRNQALLGVTGSGKTFTMANVIAKLNKPSLILAHNKTLAAQLYGEFKEFFPNNSVEYFVSYYDYYQPEAYIPHKDLYIEKDSQINEQIDRMRHSATRSLLQKRDVIVVSSVSCIYGLGAPELYLQMSFNIAKRQKFSLSKLIKKLVENQYKRNPMVLERGNFRVRGDIIDIFPSHMQNMAWRISLFDDEVESIVEVDPLTGEKFQQLEEITIFANSHYVTPRPTLEQAIVMIKEELKHRVKWYLDQDKLVEAERIEKRTLFDLEMIMESGSCKGIENYSRYLSGRAPGEAPPTLFEYLPPDALFFIDESHVTVPQIGGMFNGDRARKSTLVEHGFRLPSALDNRPLKYEEWDQMRPQTIFVSATPGKTEMNYTNHKFIEQVIRPTGLIDPECIIRPAQTQVDDLIAECQNCVSKGQRVLVTTLTKKMAENLSDYLNNVGVKTIYLHSDITTLERIEIIHDLRQGKHDVLVGVNLLREGLDIPECALVAILDADKEGFLRSETSLIQTIGRAARNVEGRVILYADIITKSIESAINETNRRRNKQMAYNKEHNITPKTISKALRSIIETKAEPDLEPLEFDIDKADKKIEELHKQMLKAAQNLEFEKAATLRDQIAEIEKKIVINTQ